MKYYTAPRHKNIILVLSKREFPWKEMDGNISDLCLKLKLISHEEENWDNLSMGAQMWVSVAILTWQQLYSLSQWTSPDSGGCFPELRAVGIDRGCLAPGRWPCQLSPKCILCLTCQHWHPDPSGERTSFSAPSCAPLAAQRLQAWSAKCTGLGMLCWTWDAKLGKPGSLRIWRRL